jgi:hypothetical protein
MEHVSHPPEVEEALARRMFGFVVLGVITFCAVAFLLMSR